MGTSNRFYVFLGGALVATAWSFHAANTKLVDVVMARAKSGGIFPLEAQIKNSTGLVLKSSTFEAPIFSDGNMNEGIV